MEKSVERAKRLPRYQEIRLALEKSITSGEWRPGDRVPPEMALVDRYGCSRMTVNKALSALASAGLIVRKRRAGSFVANPKSQETVLEIHDIQAEIIATGRPYHHDILWRAVRRAAKGDTERLGVQAGAKVLAIGVLHYAGAVPYAVEDRLISLLSVPGAETQDFSSFPPGTWLLDRIPWTQAEHTIKAMAAERETAAQLQIHEGDPCLVVERKTWHAGAWITCVRLSYPGERHELLARFAPGGMVKPASRQRNERNFAIEKR